MSDKIFKLGIGVLAALYASYADAITKEHLEMSDRILVVGLSVVGFYYLAFQILFRIAKKLTRRPQ